jgi:hypothetical protein
MISRVVLRALCMTAFLGPPAVRAENATINSSTPSNFQLLVLDGDGVRWGVRGAGIHSEPQVTYAFATRHMSFPKARNCRGLSSLHDLLQRSKIKFDALRRETRAAFDAWQGAARITFHEVADPAHADIVIGAQTEAQGRAFTNVDHRPGDNEIEKSLICLNPQKGWKIGFDGNLDVYDLRYTLTHEIGHAIGLDHPDGNGVVMSFRYREGSWQLHSGDIQGAATLYGARSTSREAPVLASTGHKLPPQRWP